MKSRPPALNLNGTPPSSSQAASSTTSSYINSGSGGRRSSKSNSDPKSPPLPTPPLAKKENEVQGDFEIEMERALGKVGKAPDKEKKQPIVELTIPIGLH
jgi:hypothetical protein